MGDTLQTGVLMCSWVFKAHTMDLTKRIACFQQQWKVQVVHFRLKQSTMGMESPVAMSHFKTKIQIKSLDGSVTPAFVERYSIVHISSQRTLHSCLLFSN